MSTKDISRSALEGGRAKYNKEDRHESHRRERSRARAWLAHNGNAEGADASNPEERPHVEKGFTDRLNPCYRWLASRAGQRWDDVYSELRSKFDTRTLASWHIVMQHMLREVWRGGSEDEYRAQWMRLSRFYVDDDGLLRDRGPKHYRGSYRDHTSRTDCEAVMRKAAGRGVVDYGVSQFWLDPVGHGWEDCSRVSRCPAYCSDKDHRLVDRTTKAMAVIYTESSERRAFRDSPHWRNVVAQHPVNTTWRQGKRLTVEEAAWWADLNSKLRGLLVRKI
jgi:hypothetical protein